VIDFLCPNGHRIHCPNEQAGRAAKCPRCGVKFIIPDASAAGVPGSSDSGSSPSHPELSDSGVSQAAAEGVREVSQQEPEIEFLCPKGHRLHGAASLQGRPGECPECGSRFRIPTYDEVPEEEAAQSGIDVGRIDGSGSSTTALPLEERLGEAVGAARTDQRADVAQPIQPHPLAALFSKLWAERPPGTAIELHLAGGETLLPERFAPALSQHSHGVFALREPAGTHTLTVVAWDSVVRIQIRGVAVLPEEMRD
jgi:DNA-directed RNA polymerase subunit RPC12/RpoP